MDERKKLMLILSSLIVFMVYMIIIALLFLFSLFTGIENRWLDFGLYFGNVVAFGLSFFIISKGKVVPFPFMRSLGVLILLMNAWGIIRFYL